MEIITIKFTHAKWQHLNELQAMIILFKALPSYAKGIFEYAVAY